jgi:hypothetical protein
MSKKSIDPALYQRLQAEARAPYRVLRRFFYGAMGASAFLGGLVFLAKVAAGRDLDSTLPNLALQSGVVALAILLYRWDKPQT